MYKNVGQDKRMLENVKGILAGYPMDF